MNEISWSAKTTLSKDRLNSLLSIFKSGFEKFFDGPMQNYIGKLEDDKVGQT